MATSITIRKKERSRIGRKRNECTIKKAERYLKGYQFLNCILK